MLLDVADIPQGLVVPESAVELPVAGDAPKVFYNQCLEDAQRARI